MQGAGSTRRSERGFTLTELLVVIAILGIISGVVVFAVGGIGDRGQASSCDADKKTVETAQEAYYAKKNAYANNVAALVTEKLLKSPSKWYRTTNSGTVTPIPGNPGNCT